jgi:chromosome segregation ATPase
LKKEIEGFRENHRLEAISHETAINTLRTTIDKLEDGAIHGDPHDSEEHISVLEVSLKETKLELAEARDNVLRSDQLIAELRNKINAIEAELGMVISYKTV